jgi:hypothetical protein
MVAKAGFEPAITRYLSLIREFICRHAVGPIHFASL